MPRHVLLRRVLSQNGQLQAISPNSRGILIPFDPTMFDEQLGGSLEEMGRLMTQTHQIVPMIEWSQTMFRELKAFLPNRSELLLGSLRNAEQLRGQVQLLSVETLHASKAVRISEPLNPEAMAMLDTRLDEDFDDGVKKAVSELKDAMKAEIDAMKVEKAANTNLLKVKERAQLASNSVKNPDNSKSKTTKSQAKNYPKTEKQKQQKIKKNEQLLEKAKENLKEAEIRCSVAKAQTAQANLRVVEAKAAMIHAWMLAKETAIQKAVAERDARDAMRAARGDMRAARGAMNEDIGEL
jgi:hypothetical protein